MAFYVVFSGNNFPNENQMNRNCGLIDQMERIVVKPHQSNNLQALNSEMNTNTNMNMNSSQSPPNNAALKPTIPTTIDGLIEYIAKNGDENEEKIIAEIAQMNERTLFR